MSLAVIHRLHRSKVRELSKQIADLGEGSRLELTLLFDRFTIDGQGAFGRLPLLSAYPASSPSWS